ncbi:unnamed protein product, partial [Iphiclides podalirius]
MQLGAIPLLDIGLCDYQHDLGHDAVMSPWLDKLFINLQYYFPNMKMENLSDTFIPKWKVSLLKQEKNNFEDNINEDIYFSKGQKNNYIEANQLQIMQNMRTTDENHFQDVRLLTLKTCDESKLDYKPGDVFNIRPRNSKEDARLRREYLYRKSVEDKQKSIQAKKDQLKRSLEENIPIHGDLRKEALALQKKIEFEDKGPERAAVIGGFSGGANTLSSQDDEYRYAGVEDPKIMITTSREPSARLKMFVKELRLIFPNSQRMNRGGYEMTQLIHACRANDVTDFIVVHEHRGVPDSLVICHLPYGPTASFTLSGVVMRHDIPDIGPMSEQFPHLIFHNFKSDLGLRTMNILKYLFPVPKPDSKRVITFANNDDYICFRQHTYKKAGKEIELTEIGPRFQMKLYEIKLGTLDALEAADTEWALRPYMNTAAKRRFLSDEDGWQEEQ